MKKEKLSLEVISVKSFQTNLSDQKAQTVKGGYYSDCCTRQFVDCQSGEGSGGCNSCGGTGGGGGGTGLNCGTRELITCYSPCD
ncbi:pinensin family lanthipeptide [Roseivirga sp. BDSF3-8]|uniref:pinensin family lanthipeptide n=1 Tax=Roseivirga sp. BDSF3-8 TaxID=3241598 RepID=UPI0035326A7F